MTVQFYGITFDLPAGWEDVTDDLPGGGPPTLAKASGVGVIQFSIAEYGGGEKPNSDFDVLRSFMMEFCRTNFIDVERIFAAEFGDVTCVSVSSRTTDQNLSPWYLSDGADFAFDDDAIPLRMHLRRTSRPIAESSIGLFRSDQSTRTVNRHSYPGEMWMVGKITEVRS